MYQHIFIANRLIKLLANLTKMLAYPFHALFPKKRFIIPTQAKAWLPSKKSSKIPRIIWQTNYSNRVALPLYINYLFNRLLSLTYEYRYVSTEERVEFIKANYSEETFNTYSQLKDGAAQADLWRLLVLQKIGGVYMDIDAHLVWPLSRIIKANDAEMYVEERADHFSNFFLASAPNNRNLAKTIDIILDNINQRKTEKGVYYLTGPIALNQVLAGQAANYRFRRYLCEQGNFTNEYFQYIDKPNGKWIHVKEEDLLK
jgi:mannosyltransferase OCH1-like enzyme